MVKVQLKWKIQMDLSGVNWIIHAKNNCCVRIDYSWEISTEKNTCSSPFTFEQKRFILIITGQHSKIYTIDPKTNKIAHCNLKLKCIQFLFWINNEYYYYCIVCWERVSLLYCMLLLSFCLNYKISEGSQSLTHTFIQHS